MHLCSVMGGLKRSVYKKLQEADLVHATGKVPVKIHLTLANISI